MHIDVVAELAQEDICPQVLRISHAQKIFSSLVEEIRMACRNAGQLFKYQGIVMV